MALSSAILYLAIVAIWAIVLVPRWLRPPQASGTLESNLAEPVAASALEDLAEAEEDPGGGESVPAPGAQAVGGGRARPAAAERRERVLQARRRMLVTLTAIAAGAAAIDGQPILLGPPRGTCRRRERAARFATLTAVPLGL